MQYIREYPKRNIYLFSYLKNDKTLDAVKKIMRIDIYHDAFINEKLNADDFKHSMVIFDDIDCIPDTKLKLKVFNVLQQILQIGRHDDITVCFAAHEVTNRNETKA